MAGGEQGPGPSPVRSADPLRAFALLFAFALVLHAAVYAGSLSNGFTFDDAVIIVSGPEVNGSIPLRDAFVRPYFPKGRDDQGVAYRPVTLVSLGLDVRLFGLSPAAIHASNVAWAAAGAALVGLLFLETGGGAAAAAAGLFLASLHPARSEAILSGVGRSELLALAFTAAALLLARRALGGRAGPAIASGALFLLALGSKESAFAAPAVLALLLVLEPARRRPRGLRGLRPLLPLLASWTGALVLAFAARYAVLGGFLAGPSAVVDPSDNPLAGLSLAARVPPALALVPLAAARILFPRTLVADYGSNALAPLLAAPAGQVVLGLLLLASACVVVLALVLARRAKTVAATFTAAEAGAPALVLGWGLAAWVPFANVLFPTGTVFAERLLYVPATCAAFAAAGLAWPLVRDRGRAAVGILVSVLLALGLLGGARIVRRVPEWRDDGTLFASVLRDCPGNGRAALNLALLALSAGDAPGAGARIAEALSADPRLRPRVLALLAHAERIGRPDLAGAIRKALD